MDGDVQIIEPAKVPQASAWSPPSQSDIMITAIMEIARNKDIDIDRVDRLMAMQKELKADDARTSYFGSMAKAQSAMAPISTDASNPQTKSRYASYHALDRAIRPIYTANGFSVSFGTADSPLTDHIRIVAHCRHAGGHEEIEVLDMPNDGKGAKGGDVMTKTHAQGAAITYGRRYLLGMVFNIAVGDDADGNKPDSARDYPVAVQACIASLNNAQTVADLKDWHGKNIKMVDTFGPKQIKDISDLYARRLTALKAKEAGQ